MAANEENPRVMMVDDDPDFQTIVQGWLSPHYEHIGLSDGEDLLKEMEVMDPHLLILDVSLPGSDGFRLCRTVRSDPRFKHLPILFLTGSKKDEDFLKNIEVGGTAYLTKPISRDALLSVLYELMPPRVI